MLLLAACSVPFLGFLRRISAGPQAHTSFDPLILFPFILVGIAILTSLNRNADVNRDEMSGSNRRWMVWGSVIFSIGVFVSILFHAAFSPDVLYFAFTTVLPVFLTVLIATGAVPDVWKSLSSALPLIGVIVGIYGIVQFFYLPDWDKSWMVNSKLESIGHPEPLAVRVFGMSESPGPYAALVGLVVVVCVDRALKSKAFRQLGWFSFAGLLTVPLLLSGVRSALLGLLICAGAATIIRGRGIWRLVAILFFVGIGFGIDRLVSLFGGSSTILTADRYTSFDPSRDGSVQARLGLLEYLINPWSHLLGNPTAPAVDNFEIDILRAYGILPFVIVVIGVVVLGWSSFRLLSSNSTSSSGLSTLYLLVLSLSGNLFLSSFGIIMAIIFGSAMRNFRRVRSGDNFALQHSLPRYRSQ